MALNHFMHERNRYKHNRPDFVELAKKYPEFQKHVDFNEAGKAVLDFSDPEALRALTCTLLKEDFNLEIEIPLDHIIPTVPLRLNYIHWLEDLLEGACKDEHDNWGIDIGCGTSCIYPLLGARLNNWKFWALEVDPLALQCAQENVIRNGLNENITVIENTKETLFMDLVKDSSHPLKFTFTMCNPPFFKNFIEAQGLMTSRSHNRPAPKTVSTADEGEMIATGGEVEFIKRMIRESLQVRDRVMWFTSMVGKKSSLAPLKAELRDLKVPYWTITEFCQGRTMRWGIAWTYEVNTKLYVSPSRRKKKTKPPMSIPVPSSFVNIICLDSQGSRSGQGKGRQEKLVAVATAVEKVLKELQMIVKLHMQNKWSPKMEVKALQNTWSHSRRKRRQEKRKKEGNHGNHDNSSAEEEKISNVLENNCYDVYVSKTTQDERESIRGQLSSDLGQSHRDVVTDISGKMQVDQGSNHEDSGAVAFILKDAICSSLAVPAALIADQSFRCVEKDIKHQVEAAPSTCTVSTEISSQLNSDALSTRSNLGNLFDGSSSKMQKLSPSLPSQKDTKEKQLDGDSEVMLGDFKSSMRKAMLMSFQIPATVVAGDGFLSSNGGSIYKQGEDENSRKRKLSEEMVPFMKEAFETSYSLPAAIIGKGDFNSNREWRWSINSETKKGLVSKDDHFTVQGHFMVNGGKSCTNEASERKPGDGQNLNSQSNSCCQSALVSERLPSVVNTKHTQVEEAQIADRKSEKHCQSVPGGHKHSALCDPTLEQKNKDCVLQFEVHVKVGPKGGIMLEMKCGEGESRNLLHQVGQYLKNHMQSVVSGKEVK